MAGTPSYVFCGSGMKDGKTLWAMGDRRTAGFPQTMALCRDPIRPKCWYLCDGGSIRYFDEAKDAVTLFAGDREWGTVDGVGADARFDRLESIAITTDGLTLWCNQNHYQTACLRRINTATREVSTIEWRLADAEQIVLDRTPGSKRESGLFFRTQSLRRYPKYSGNIRTIARFNFADESVIRYALPASGVGQFFVTPTGHVLFCDGVYNLYAFDPNSCDKQGKTRGSVSEGVEIEFIFHAPIPHAVTLIDSTRTIVHVDSHDKCFKTITLPQKYF